MPDAVVVLDAAALVDLVAGTELAPAVRRQVRGAALHAPSLLDAEVLSALGRLNRAGLLDDASVRVALSHVVRSPIQRHPLPPLLDGAWARRHDLRLTDALYVELGAQLGVDVVTTDARLARAAPGVVCAT